MASKSPEAKAIEKQTKEAKKNARHAALVERAKSVVSCAEKINGIVIVDEDSKIVLDIALKKYDGNERNSVTLEATDVPVHLMQTLPFECEKLHQYGLVSSYMPLGGSVMLTLSTAGKTYFEKLVDHSCSEVPNMRNEIFISHRYSDKEYADMLQDYLVGCGVPKDVVFCSSLPGNDVHKNIPKEVKEHLKHSAVNIILLSSEYFDSYYCLNEAGIIWYTEEEVPFIVIGLPEIGTTDMVGFISSDYRLYRLDVDTDLSHILDTVSERLKLDGSKHTIVTREIEKLKVRYYALNATRNHCEKVSETIQTEEPIPISSDAAILLSFASMSDDARIMSIDINGGRIIATGKYQFTNGVNVRNKARWQAAIEELMEHHYVIPIGHDGELYEITADGFDMIDTLISLDSYGAVYNSPREYFEDNIKEDS